MGRPCFDILDVSEIIMVNIYTVFHYYLESDSFPLLTYLVPVYTYKIIITRQTCVTCCGQSIARLTYPASAGLLNFHK